jgi:hypothetical protein
VAPLSLHTNQLSLTRAPCRVHSRGRGVPAVGTHPSLLVADPEKTTKNKETTIKSYAISIFYDMQQRDSSTCASHFSSKHEAWKQQGQFAHSCRLSCMTSNTSINTFLLLEQNNERRHLCRFGTVLAFRVVEVLAGALCHRHGPAFVGHRPTLSIASGLRLQSTHRGPQILRGSDRQFLTSQRHCKHGD